MADRLTPDEVTEALGPADEGLGSTRRGKALVALGILVILATLFLTLGRGPAREAEGLYVTKQAERRDLTITVSATGNLEPTNEVEISSELSGIIRAVRVDTNSTVAAGDVLAELDTDRLEAELAHANARLAAAKARIAETDANYAEAKRRYDRFRSLLGRGTVSQQDFDGAKADYERAIALQASAAADQAVAEADLSLRQTERAKASILAPINGLVLSREVDPGQTVASSFQAPVLFVLAEDLTAMVLEVDVDEADVSLVEPGQAAEFTVDAYPTRRFPATIEKVLFAPDTTEGVVTYRTELSVDNDDLALRPGMTATAEITVRSLENVLVVPNEALRFVPPAKEVKDERSFIARLMPGPPRRPEPTEDLRARNLAERTLYTLGEDGSLVARPVTIGLSDGRFTQILEGDIEPGLGLVIDLAGEATS